MSSMKINNFTSYDFTEQEIMDMKFSSLQVQLLQNLLSDSATEKVEIAFDTKNPDLFRLQHEYLRGQMDILKILIDNQDLTINATSEQG